MNLFPELVPHEPAPMPGVPDNRLAEPLAAYVERLPAAWKAALGGALAAPSFAALQAYVDGRRAQGAVVYPATPFRALELTAPQDARVVILGQDPYHGPGQAQGLAFSVPSSQKRPPSLRNIFKEVAACYGGDPKGSDNDLSRWARQGVLLLNTSLTVEDGAPASHAKRGWEALTDAVIAAVAADPKPKVFMLWGAHAQAKAALLPAGPSAGMPGMAAMPDGHLVLAANHPSPLSATRPPAPFLGCRHFLRANQWLAERGLPPVAW